MAGWATSIGAVVCPLLLILIGILASNPAWHEALHEGIHEAGPGIQDAALPVAPEDHDRSHPGDSCAVCAYLHQQVGGVGDTRAVVVLLQVSVVPGFLQPSETILAAFRRGPGGRGPPAGV